MRMMLSDTVRVAQRFRRSVRIDTDIGDSDALQGFICHSSGRSVLETMARLMLESGQRAITWTGPYGCGKSSLALALGAAVGRNAELRKTAQRLLRDVPLLDRVFPVGKHGWLVVPLVGRRGDPVHDIRERLNEAIAKGSGRAGAPRRKADRSGLDVIERLQAEAKARPESGVLLLLDEMGKYLEGAAANGADIHFFQELAEAADRCEGRLVVLGILHQSFEQYAARLGSESRDEWAKVQGRYVDISIAVAIDEVIDLLGRAIMAESHHPDTGNGARVLPTLLRYRGAALAEFMRCLRTLQALQAETRAAGLPAAPRARRRARYLPAGRNEPETIRQNDSLTHVAAEPPAAPDHRHPYARPALPPTAPTTRPIRESPDDQRAEVAAPGRSRHAAPGRDRPAASPAALPSPAAATKRTREMTLAQSPQPSARHRSAA